MDWARILAYITGTVDQKLVPTTNPIRCQLWETDLDDVEIRKIDKSASRV